MFQIDLLKGQARPYRPNLAAATALAALFAVAIIAALWFGAGAYAKQLQWRAVERQNRQHQAALEELKGDVAYVCQLRQKIDAASKALGEIGFALSFRQTVSDFLVELANAMPAEITLRDAQFKRTGRLERKPAADGAVKHDISVQRFIEMTLCGPDAAQTDAALQLFLEQFKTNPACQSRASDVRIVSRQQNAESASADTLYQIQFICNEQRFVR